MTMWDEGRYELTATRLEPAAEVAVDALGPLDGRRVLDVGCGTGNAALAAARRGATVTGLDPAERLLAVARERAAREGLDVAFAAAEATALGLPDDAFDAVVSVFAVIFADPARAAAELLRVLRPGGRIVLTTWVPEGPIAQLGEVIREALGGPPQPPRWSSRAFVEELFAPHDVAFARHDLAFTAASLDEYLAEQAEHHPMALASRPALERAGRQDEVTARVRDLFADANEDPAAFRTTSRYDVVTVDVR